MNKSVASKSISLAQSTQEISQVHETNDAHQRPATLIRRENPVVSRTDMLLQPERKRSSVVIGDGNAKLGSKHATVASHNSLQEALYGSSPRIVVHPRSEELEDQEPPAAFETWLRRRCGVAPTKLVVKNRSAPHSEKRKRTESFSEAEYDDNPHLLIVDQEQEERVEVEGGPQSPFITPSRRCDNRRLQDWSSSDEDDDQEQSNEGSAQLSLGSSTSDVTLVLGLPLTPKDRSTVGG